MIRYIVQALKHFFNPPKTVGEYAARLQAQAVMLDREDDGLTVCEFWQLKGFDITLFNSSGNMPLCYIQVFHKDPSHACNHSWNVEVDTGMDLMLRETCYFIASRLMR